MRTFAKSRVRYTKSQRMGIFAFIVLLLGLEIYAYWQLKNREPLEFENYPLIIQPEASSSKQAPLTVFNVNELDAEAWQAYGFSEKQAHSIIKYKYSLGGFFSSKEELKACFVISEKKYAELEPYMEFGDLEKYKRASKTWPSASMKINYTQFNPNDYQLKDWQRIGFTERQSETILKYKKSLGGRFTSINQLKECFVISDEKFREMRPYIILPTEKPKKKVDATIELVEEEIPTKSESGELILIE